MNERIKKCEKSVKIVWKVAKKLLIFATASREKREARVLKNNRKKSEKLLEIRKFALPLHPLPIRQSVEAAAKKVLKNF